MPKYRVAYRIEYQGFTLVEATDPKDAREIVDDGDFDESRAQERCNWQSFGTPEKVED